MANRINQAVMINGKKCWITAKTAQEFADKIANLLAGGVQQKGKHTFAERTNMGQTVTGGCYRQFAVTQPCYGGPCKITVAAHRTFHNNAGFAKMFNVHVLFVPFPFFVAENNEKKRRINCAFSE